MSIDEQIEKIVAEKVEKALEEKLPAFIRALGLKEAPPRPELVDATEIARMLGEDVSTKEKARKAAVKVYDMASRNLIPSVRLSPKRIRFDPVKVEEVIAKGGNAERAAS